MAGFSISGFSFLTIYTGLRWTGLKQKMGRWNNGFPSFHLPNIPFFSQINLLFASSVDAST
jgi:hypothetical protein